MGVLDWGDRQAGGFGPGLDAGPVAFSGGLNGFDPSFEFPVDDTEFWSVAEGSAGTKG